MEEHGMTDSSHAGKMKELGEMEEKQLLLKDLCARLPYGVKVRNTINGEIFDLKVYLYCLPSALTTNFKPYLRPMSSMTDAEDMHCCAFLDDIDGGVEEAIPNYIDFLNEHHFDYRGLIENGLALEAPEEMYQ